MECQGFAYDRVSSVGTGSSSDGPRTRPVLSRPLAIVPPEPDRLAPHAPEALWS